MGTSGVENGFSVIMGGVENGYKWCWIRKWVFSEYERC